MIVDSDLIQGVREATAPAPYHVATSIASMMVQKSQEGRWILPRDLATTIG